MKKNGFTLIELLAVIVILAIIALIATPIVLNIIKDSKNNAQLRSAEMYVDAVEQAVAKEKMNDTTFSPNTCEIQTNGNLICDENTTNEITVEVKGEKPTSGTITFTKGKVDQVTLEYSDKTITKDSTGSLVYLETLEPGLYDENDKLVKSWDELINNGVISVSNDGVLSSNNANNLVGKLVIPDTVKRIGESAFSKCKNLTEIIIPDSVTSIGYSAFIDCESLTNINIPEGVTSINMHTFNGCESLISVTLPNSVTSIGDYAFSGCESLTNINIPEGVTSIGKNVFSHCASLKKITIPSSVTSIGSAFLWGCTNLESINVEENNTVYDSRDNCNAIIETSTNTLIEGSNKTIIPNSVKNIGKNAFGCRYDLKSIQIPTGVINIDYGAFYYCTSLSEITIPSSVTNIGSGAFNYCENISKVNYTGTTSQWSTITIGSNNDYLTNATINYNYVAQ